MLAEYLARHREAIVSEWFDRIVDRYPPETAGFLRKQRDPFANPVGAALRDELGPLFDGVVGGGTGGQPEASLDRILRVRALQDFTAAQAVGFVLVLKELLRARTADHPDRDALEALDGRLDRLLLLAFDTYTRCREQISEIRIREIRSRSLDHMERLQEWLATRDAPGGGAAGSH